jgi:hypothetical protein
MDLFKRAGIEAIPVMDGLKERVDRAKSLGFGITEADVKKYEELNKKAVEFEMRWESAIRSVKGMLLDLASAFGWVLDKIATKPPTPSKASLADQQQHAARVAALETQGQAAWRRTKCRASETDGPVQAGRDGLAEGGRGGGRCISGNQYPGRKSEFERAAVWPSRVAASVREGGIRRSQNKPQPHAPLGEPPTSTGENGNSRRRCGRPGVNWPATNSRSFCGNCGRAAGSHQRCD